MEVFTLLYRIKEEKEIRIFGRIFVENNKRKCKMVIKGKILPLTDEYKVEDKNINILKIKLILMDKYKLNFREMFYECKSLVRLEINSEEEGDLKLEENIKEEPIETNNIINIYDNDENVDKYFYPEEKIEFPNLSVQNIKSNETKNSISTKRMNEINDCNYNYTFISSVNDYEFENLDPKEQNLYIESPLSLKTTNPDTKNNDEIEFLSSENDNPTKISLKKSNKRKLISIINMNNMFSGCSSLISLPSKLNWNTENVLDMSYMFNKCSSLKSLPDISNWNPKNVKYINHMFNQCSSLISLPDISKWKIDNITFMSFLFSECSSVKNLPDISKWNISNLKYMNNLFDKCVSLTYLPDISKWDTKNVHDMSFLFNECSSLLSLPDISKSNIYSIIDMRSIFHGCSSLLSLPDISKWNTNNLKNLRHIFHDCTSLKSLPNISKWNTINLNDMSSLFNGCLSLLSIPDISKWEIKNVCDMQCVFKRCTKILTIPDISKWNTGNISYINSFLKIAHHYYLCLIYLIAIQKI